MQKVFQRYLTTLSKSSVNPVKVSQVLYNERCISEEILDEMEEFQGTLEEKKKLYYQLYIQQYFQITGS